MSDHAELPLEISVTDVDALRNDGADFRLVDVRTTMEREMACIDGSDLLDDKLFETMKAEWSKDTHVVAYCHSGIRSLNAAQFLRQAGFERTQSMMGGIGAWSMEIDSSIPQY